MVLVTQENLKSIMPTAYAEKWVEVLNQAMDRFEINTPQRAAAFLAQIAHESTELNDVEENLNYSAEGLRKTWPNRFPNLNFANQYAHQKIKIANFVYANRLGNGNEAGGDGWKFRGRGLIQLTGRNNYTEKGKVLNLDLVNNPDLVAQPETAASTAALFWKSEGLNELADVPSDENFVKITKKINGGTTGLDARKAYWEKAKKALGVPT